MLRGRHIPKPWGAASTGTNARGGRRATEQGGRKQECQAGGAMPEWLPGLVTGKDSQLAPGAGSGLAAGERRVRPSAL